MLRDEVAGHYRAKGYTINERVRVRGQSGAIHAVDMVAQGPLGNLVIAIEDAGGFEGPEMHAVRRAAKDIGATAVMAARTIPDGLRRQASEAGVVLLDERGLSAKPPVEVPVDDGAIDYPPWPGQERAPVERAEIIDDFAPRRSGKSTDPGIWRYPRDGAAPTAEQPKAERAASAGPRATTASADPIEIEPEPPAKTEGFGWLPKEEIAVAPLRRATVAAQVPQRGMARWVVGAVAFGASAGAVLYALSRIFG